MDQAWISMYNESKTMYIWGMCPTPKLMSNGEPTVHPRFSYRTKGNSSRGVFRSLKNHPKIQTFHHISITSKH